MKLEESNWNWLLTEEKDGIRGLLGDGIDSINNTRDVAKQGEYKTYPELHLHQIFI